MYVYDKDQRLTIQVIQGLVLNGQSLGEIGQSFSVTVSQWVDDFHGKIFTGNHGFSHEIWEFPVMFSLKPIN